MPLMGVRKGRTHRKDGSKLIVVTRCFRLAPETGKGRGTTRILGTIVLRNEAIHRDRLSQGDGTNCDRRKKSSMAVYGETARPWSRSGSRRKQPIGALAFESSARNGE